MDSRTDNRRLCVIIPTYNNVRTIRRVVTDVLQYCSQVIVVDDGSTDGTSVELSILSELITIVTCQPNGGKGIWDFPEAAAGRSQSPGRSRA